MEKYMNTNYVHSKLDFDNIIKELNFYYEPGVDVIFILQNPNISGAQDEINNMLDKFGLLCKRFSEEVENFLYSNVNNQENHKYNTIHPDQSQVDEDAIINSIPDNIQTISEEELKLWLTKPLIILEGTDKQTLIEGNYITDGKDVIVHMSDMEIDCLNLNNKNNRVIILRDKGLAV